MCISSLSVPEQTNKEESIVKSWLASKTLWFNVIAAVSAVIVENVSSAGLDPNITLAVVTVGNFILRLVTKEPVTLRPNV